jgi:hypothetical protein
VSTARIDGLDEAQRAYLAEIQHRVRRLGTEVWLRTTAIQAMWLVVVLAGAGIPLNTALGGPGWVEPSLGFVVVAAAGIERIFVRTSGKAATVDVLRRALAHECRLLSAGTGGDDEQRAGFESFVERCESAILAHDRQVVEDDRQLLASG